PIYFAILRSRSSAIIDPQHAAWHVDRGRDDARDRVRSGRLLPRASSGSQLGAAPAMHNGVSAILIAPRARAVAALAGLGCFCRRKPLGAIGGLIVLVLIVLALFAGGIAPYPYDEPIAGARLRPPSAQFWMGTDNLGREMWSRGVYGARVSVTVGFGAVLLGIFLATIIGVTSGYFAGRYDIVVQRVVDAWQSFPFLVITLSLMAVLGPGQLNVILALGVVGAAGASRVIRGATIGVAHNPYVEAARALGCGHLRI